MKSLDTLDHKVALLALLSDATRLRLLSVLAERELSVIELTQVMELGQSKVSTHLARLREQSLVVDRKVGTSAYYRLNAQGMPLATRQLWETLRGSLHDATLVRDLRRALAVLDARDKKSWPERMAGELERHYSPGRTWESLARAFAGLAQPGRVLDLGAGDGTVAEMLAPRALRYLCLDVSPTLCAAASTRLRTVRSASVLAADMHALPLRDGSFDQVLALNVLAYAERPGDALDEALRVLAPGGDFVLVTLNKHGSMDVAAQYGHVQPGFEPRWLKKRIEARGLRIVRCDVTSREKSRPNFEIITCFATKS